MIAVLASSMAAAVPAHAKPAKAAKPTAQPKAASPTKFDFDVLQNQAKAMAAKPYVERPSTVPKAWKKLDYDQFRDIRFRPEESIWKDGLPFQLRFFHLGFFYDQPVRIHTVKNGIATPVIYRHSMFDFGANQLEPVNEDVGFGGFRVHHPLNRPEYFDELITFLGASYFRVLGRGQRYGLSARGLAIDTAMPKGEEFPIFRAFYIEEPKPDASELTVYALLDSQSLAGAYRFVIHPGTVTDVVITASLFARKDVNKVGVAPLTSMFLFGEDKTRAFDDFRPEVHDSDGLLLNTGAGETVWRPLANPRGLRVSAFMDDNPKGFGLLQRDQKFDRYQDLEAAYEKRPSVWIEPVGQWGPGHVELVEIPSEEEIHDNIVAYWVSQKPLKKGEALQLTYRMRSFLELPELTPRARVESTRVGNASREHAKNEEARLFVIDFEGGELPLLLAEQPVEALVTASSGRFSDVVVQKNPTGNGWRVFFKFHPEDKAADLRCQLALRGTVLTETWTYLWSP